MPPLSLRPHLAGQREGLRYRIQSTRLEHDVVKQSVMGWSSHAKMSSQALHKEAMFFEYPFQTAIISR